MDVIVDGWPLTSYFWEIPPDDRSFLKAHSQDPILRIRFLFRKIGSRCSDGPISRFCLCDENVRRSYVVCSHDPIFRTDKES